MQVANNAFFVPIAPNEVLAKESAYTGPRAEKVPSGQQVCFFELNKIPLDAVTFKIANTSVDLNADLSRARPVRPVVLKEVGPAVGGPATGKFAAFSIKGPLKTQLELKAGDTVRIWALNRLNREVAVLEFPTVENSLDYPTPKKALVQTSAGTQWVGIARDQGPEYLAQAGYPYARTLWANVQDTTPPWPNLETARIERDGDKFWFKADGVAADLRSAHVWIYGFKQGHVRPTEAAAGGHIGYLLMIDQLPPAETPMTLYLTDINGQQTLVDFTADPTAESGIRQQGVPYQLLPGNVRVPVQPR
jgi:hypothetical protein